MRITIILFHLLMTAAVPCLAQVLEAENGILSGTQISTQRSGYSGTGYVTGFDADEDKVTWIVNIDQKGIYKLHMRYSSPSGQKFNFIYVNGQNMGSVEFAMSNDFREMLAGKVYLLKGENRIAIVKEWGYFDLDNIRLEASEASAINPISDHLITPNVSTKTIALYDFLSKTYGKVILSGQYGGDTEFNKIKSASGKTPLIRGFDLIDYTPSRVERGTTSDETEKAIEWNSKKGITTFSWHWNAPKDLLDTKDHEWYSGFYTHATTFDVTKAMNNPASEEYTLLIRDIDVIAVQLKKLKDANVPVLWRPLHEAEGAWFWWGAKGPDACKWLWKLLFDRLVNHHQLDNLIWVWTSTGTPTALDWYPGDQYVDIIGADIYLPAGSYSSNFLTFSNIVSLYGGKKIVTLSENGPLLEPDRLFQENAAWSWFCTWGGDFILNGVFNTTAQINKVFNHEYVITLDELDNVDTIIAALEDKKEDDDDEVVLGTDESANSFLRYQNPIRNNRLTISSEGINAISKIVIYNVHGQIEFSETNPNTITTHFEFDFQDRSTGLYFVKVTMLGSSKVFRVIKI